MSKLRASKSEQTGKPKPKASLREYTISVLCVEAPAQHPEWQGKQWVRLDPTPWGPLHQHASRRAWCERAAGWIAQQIERAEGGRWRGVLRDASGDHRPERPMSEADMAALRQHIESGPDGPGRRFLAQQRGSTAPMLPTMPGLPAWAQRVVGAGPEDAY